MQEKMVDLRKKWKREGFYNPFEIRIGLNTGIVMLETLEVHKG